MIGRERKMERESAPPTQYYRGGVGERERDGEREREREREREGGWATGTRT